MKGKIILVLEVPHNCPDVARDRMIHSTQERVQRWEKDPDEKVLGLVVPAGCNVRAYGIPDELIKELPEILVRVEEPQQRIPGVVKTDCGGAPSLDRRDAMLEARFKITETNVARLRERIRDLEERGEEVLDPGSKQKGRKARRLDNVIQELSKRYGLISQSTSFVAVEEREEKDKTTGELQLRKVPVPITIGWHGMGSVHGNEMLHERDLGVTVECSKMESSSVIHKLEMCTDLLPTVHRDHTISKARETIPLEIPSSDTDLVLAILATQKADGGMELTKELAELLDLDYMEFKNAVTKLTLPNPQIDAHTLLSTTVLLQVLESRFISHSSTWSKVVKKSRKWMQKITTKYQVMIGNEDMHSWVGMFLRTQS